MDDKQNYILAIALSLIILIAWQYFYASRRWSSRSRARSRRSAWRGAACPTCRCPRPATFPPERRPRRPRSGGCAGDRHRQPRHGAGAQPRVEIDTPSIRGSVALRGARIDDVVLKHYRETVDPTSPNIVLLSPSGSPDPFYAEVGWVPAAAASRCLTATRCGRRRPAPG
jgi:YidC/Oxa1 family membrane protein insertase